MEDSFSRRQLLAAGTLAVGLGLAGCAEQDDADQEETQPEDTDQDDTDEQHQDDQPDDEDDGDQQEDQQQEQDTQPLVQNLDFTGTDDIGLEGTLTPRLEVTDADESFDPRLTVTHDGETLVEDVSFEQTADGVYLGEDVPVTDEGEYTAELTDAGDGVEIADGHRHTTYTHTIIDFQEIYEETYDTENEPIDPEATAEIHDGWGQDDTKTVQLNELYDEETGEIHDIETLMKAANQAHVTRRGKSNIALKEFFHNQLNLGMDQIQIHAREAGSGSPYFAVFYKENPEDNEWNKALGRSSPSSDTHGSILLPGESNDDYQHWSSVFDNLEGLHDPNDVTNTPTVSYQQVREGIIRGWEISKERGYSEEEILEGFQDNLNQKSDVNNTFIIGYGNIKEEDIHYTSDAARYIENILDPIEGNQKQELKLLEQSSKFYINEVEDGETMIIDYDEETGFSYATTHDKMNIKETFEVDETYLKDEAEV